MSRELVELWGNIEAGNEIRQSLSGIRALVKQNAYYDEFVSILDGNEDKLIDLLKNEDPKTRKNAVLLIGDMADSVYIGSEQSSKYMHSLYNGYLNELQLFVKASYLQALGKYDYREYADSLKRELNILTNMQMTENDKKHITEQIRVISDLLIDIEGVHKHTFTGGNVLSNIILTTNRKNVETVEKQILDIPDINPDKVKVFPAGIMLATDSINEIMSIRTYDEMLFRFAKMSVLENGYKKAAKQVADADFISYLNRRHDNKKDTPYYFRVEVKSKMDLKAKSTFVKKFSSELEILTDRKLVNSKSDYEIEIRLIENKEGRFNCLIKMYTIPDMRFSYRKESIAASLKPVNAALIVELAKEYMAQDAQVLDPFCGVATLLIERQKVVKANTSYGIDIFAEAIDKAKVNTEAAGQIIHFINKDFFEFTHEYLFDEVLTDMPFATAYKSEDEIYDIYKKFFANIRRYMKPQGKIIMYTHNREYVYKLAKEAKFKILKHIVIFEKAGTDLFILEAE